MIHPSTDDLIAFLNSLLQVDGTAVALLMRQRVGCNDALASHPTVEVSIRNGPYGECASVGMLGILNGFCGGIEAGPREGWGPITAVFDGAGALIRFERTDQAAISPSPPLDQSLDTPVPEPFMNICDCPVFDPNGLPRTGDHLFHRPSGETWLVRRVVGDRVECFGWPRSQARLADCEIVRRCTNEEHKELLPKAAE